MTAATYVLIPALNEASTIASLIAAIPDSVGGIYVVDNGSNDGTGTIAARAGATVVTEPQRGYGQACLTGIAALPAADTDIVVFLDADFCEDPSLIPALTAPIERGSADMVIGSRMRRAEPGALTIAQRFGNRLACWLIRLFWGVRFTDLGPFRAISMQALHALNMADTDFGWTVEMQIKAAKHKLKTAEIEVPYRRRPSGRSKISGTISGVLRAGHKILYVVFRETLTR